MQPSVSDRQTSLLELVSASGTQERGGTAPFHQRPRSTTLSLLTAALRVSPVETGHAPESARLDATGPQQQQSQRAATPAVLTSGEAGHGEPDRPATPGQASRLPRRVLGSGGPSGDPVLLESFLAAGMDASSAEVRAPPGRAILATMCRHVFGRPTDARA